MSLPDKIARENIPVQEFAPGYTPEMFPEMPQLETKSQQLMALEIEILKGDMEDLKMRLLALENKQNE